MATSLPDTAARALTEQVHRDPGLHASELARAVGVHRSTAEYHLRRLADQRVIVGETVGRQIHYYPTGVGWCARARRIHATLTEVGHTVLAIALDKGAVSRGAVIRAGASRSAARWALDGLIEAGVLERLTWGVYVMVPGTTSCARTALTHRPCRACNPGSGGQGDHGSRASGT